MSLVGGGGTAVSFPARLHGICNASHNRMEEGTHLGHLSYRPALGLGISPPPPPCFRVLFGKVQQTTGDLKSHHLQAGVTALSVPPSLHLFFQQYMKNKCFLSFIKRALLASSGGTCPSAPPPPPGSLT